MRFLRDWLEPASTHRTAHSHPSKRLSILDQPPVNTQVNKLKQTLHQALIQVDLFFNPTFVQSSFSLILIVMFVVGYFESLRWPLPGPLATHGILKGLMLLLIPGIYFFRRKLRPPQFHLQNVLMVFFVLAYAVSAALSQAVEASVLNMWYPLVSCVMLCALSRLKLTRNHFYLLIITSVVLVFITFAFSFFSIMFRYSVDNIYYFLFLEHRANFLLDEIRKFGKYVSLGPYLMLAPLTFSFLVRRNSTFFQKVLSLFMVIITVLQSVISNNRIDVLVVGIQLLTLLAIMPKRIALFLLITLVPVVYLGLITTEKYFGFSLEERLLRPKVERDVETVTMRFTYWETALYNFKNAPFFGTGPNTYNDVSAFPIRRYWDPNTHEYSAKVDYGIGIHNIFIERLADTGLFGFITFMALLLYFLRFDILHLLRQQTPEERATYVLWALSSWSWILYGVTDNGYGAQGFVTFFFLRGVINNL